MRVLIGNTESRRRELVEALGAIMESRRMTKQETLRLRGRLQFTSGYLFGRIAKSCLTAVSNHAYSSSTSMIFFNIVQAPAGDWETTRAETFVCRDLVHPDGCLL